MATSNRTYEDASNDFDDIYKDWMSPISEEEREEAEAYVNSRGGINKCMCCGKYKYNDELTYPGQTCIKGCVNPNEF